SNTDAISTTSIGSRRLACACAHSGGSVGYEAPAARPVGFVRRARSTPGASRYPEIALARRLTGHAAGRLRSARETLGRARGASVLAVPVRSLSEADQGMVDLIAVLGQQPEHGVPVRAVLDQLGLVTGVAVSQRL